jgi:hypothetical protein
MMRREDVATIVDAGARIDPRPNQMVINKSLRCAPCIDTLAGHPCPYGAPCLCDISVAEVGEALRAQLTSSRIARSYSDAAVHAW